MNPNENKIDPKQGLVQGGARDKKKEKKYYGKLLIVIIFIIISIEYYAYVFEVMLKNMTQKNFYLILTLLIIFHILVLLLLMAFISTMSTNPGNIPLYWGFYIGDDDYKRKRYCLICNAFKPERSHHCSVCNVCVLNMDHHCPWVDNCIGFYNRKYFMQLLIFVVILTIYYDISLLYYVTKMIIALIKMRVKYSQIFHVGFVVICYIAIFIFTIIITTFLKFHLTLVAKNSTTIESLDTEHLKENEKFNLGLHENWRQVFGNDPMFWFLPIPTKRGTPEGDGLTWKTNDKYYSETVGAIENKLKRGPEDEKSTENNKINNYNTNFASNFNTNDPHSPITH